MIEEIYCFRNGPIREIAVTCKRLQCTSNSSGAHGLHAPTCSHVTRYASSWRAETWWLDNQGTTDAQHGSPCKVKIYISKFLSNWLLCMGIRWGIGKTWPIKKSCGDLIKSMSALVYFDFKMTWQSYDINLIVVTVQSKTDLSAEVATFIDS